MLLLVWSLIIASHPLALALAQSQNCGTVIAEGNSDIASFNPLFSTDEGDSRAAQLLFQPLVWVDRHGQVDAARSLASNIQVSPDARRYTLTLRPWHWSDGVSVTAADVVYDWQMIARLGQDYPGYGSGGVPQDIQSVTALDATHVQIVLKSAVNPLWFVDNGLSGFVALPQHAWQHLSLDRLYQSQSTPRFFSVVDGPMRIEKLDVGQQAVFVPNPHYDGPPLHLNRLVLIFEHSDGEALQQVESGALDFAPVPLEFYSAVQHVPNVRLALLSPVSFWYYLSLNLRNPHVAFFRDVRVRQAIADAIDQRQVIRLVYHGFGQQVYTPIPPVDANMLAPALRQGDFPVGYDPARARALLLAAGYSPGRDGIFQKAGKRLSFTTLIDSDSAETAETMVLIQAQLRAVGIELKLHQLGGNQMFALLRNAGQGWEAAEHGTVLAAYPTGEALFATGAGENEGGYSDPEMDRLIDASVNQPGMQGLYDYETYAAAQQPVIFLATDDHLELISNRIHGVDGFTDGQLLAPDTLVCSPR